MSFPTKMVLVGGSHELMVHMLGQRSGKLQPKLTHASTDLSWARLWLLCLQYVCIM